MGTVGYRRLLAQIAQRISPIQGRLRVAIDGVDGAGKSTFADGLAEVLRRKGREVVRASADDFLNPRALRYRLGRGSPEGFYRDTYDYPLLRSGLLDRWNEGSRVGFRLKGFDQHRDLAIDSTEVRAGESAILILDGMSLHRPELRELWDFSVFLDVAFEVSIPRGASRGEGFGSPDLRAESNRRYVEGQRLYFSEASPWSLASMTIDYNDWSNPKILRERVDSPAGAPYAPEP